MCYNCYIYKVSIQTITMDKIYHVYDKENHCIASVLSEDEFKKEWESKTKESEVEYIELEVNKDVLQDSSY